MTAVELEGIPETDFERLKALLDNLASQPLIFVSDIRNDKSSLNLFISCPGKEEQIKKLYPEKDNWIVVQVDTSKKQEELDTYKKKLGFELKAILDYHWPFH